MTTTPKSAGHISKLVIVDLVIAAFSYMIGPITKQAISKIFSLNKLRRKDRKTWSKANQNMRMLMKRNHRILKDFHLLAAFAVRTSIVQ